MWTCEDLIFFKQFSIPEKSLLPTFSYFIKINISIEGILSWVDGGVADEKKWCYI